MLKIKNTLNKTNAVLLLCVILLVVSGLYFFVLQKNATTNSTTDTEQKDPVGFVNLNPPTESEEKSGDQAKLEAIAAENRRNTPKQPGTITANPNITYAGVYGTQVEVGAYVSGVFEQGGTCTLTASSASESKTVEVGAVKSANSVDCPVMKLDKTSLPAGSWSITVSYASGSATGISATQIVKVD